MQRTLCKRKIFNLNLSETQYRSDANGGQRAACCNHLKKTGKFQAEILFPKMITQQKSSLRYVIIGYTVCIYVHVVQINILQT